ncbi:uncharacterized protein IL334_000533 [Kwoniella shivajii]|uniref:Uncharacterized protein n=1 Tax=Kwoniella shivajii TaxID=564305 RepID=A0ABZ1CPD2_9TREE|nr:hypothetical protein IL334_000533 [Kwoniella shivajii]
MTDPIKPRRKVTSQISLAPSPSPSSSSTVPARVRAHVNPSTVSSPTPPQRPSLRSTPSSVSIRSTPISRERSPVPAPATTSSTSTPPIRPSARTSISTPTIPLPPRSSVGLTPKSGTPIARIRATKSVVDGPSNGTGTRSPRTPDIRRSNTGLEESNRSRTQSLRRNVASSSTPIARIRTSGTPSTPSFTSSFGQSSTTNVTTPDIQTPVPQSQSPFPIPDIISTPGEEELYPTFGLGMDDGGLRILQSTWRDNSPERISDSSSHIEPTSNRSSPSHRSPTHPGAISSAQHALAYIFQHPAASAPTSPIPSSTPSSNRSPRIAPRSSGHSHTRPKLPFHPHGTHIPPLPPPPLSPELKTVALPSMTPARSSGEWSRTASSQGYFTGSRKLSETSSEFDGPLTEMKKDDRDRLSGATVVENDVIGSSAVSKAGDQDVDVVLEYDAEEAKINRKAADLEISNASLLAINKTLEATKSKQRSEILKLRRMLRESIAGNALPSFSSFHPLASPLSLLSPTTDTFDEDLDPEGAYFDEEMVDPQIEARWDKIADLVANMKRRGETAVEMGKEEIKFGPGRVLGWMEVEQKRKEDHDSNDYNDLDMSTESISITPNDELQDLAGDTSRDEVEAEI